MILCTDEEDKDTKMPRKSHIEGQILPAQSGTCSKKSCEKGCEAPDTDVRFGYRAGLVTKNGLCFQGDYKSFRVSAKR